MNQSIRIKRGTPEEFLFYLYEIDLPPGATILDALEYIRTGSAPDLMYRHSCHHGSCGTCAVRINGKEVLACLTRLDTFADSVPIIEPLAAFKMDKDLVIDPGTLFRLFPKNTSRLRTSEWTGGEINQDSDMDSNQVRPSGIERFVRFEDCIECGACISACPVINKGWNDESVPEVSFVGPAVLAAIHRESINCVERYDEMIELAKVPNGVGACEKHFDCSRVCPRMVYPGKHIELLRKEIL